MNSLNTTIKEYLINKGIPFKEKGGELVCKCIFNDCDKNNKNKDGHLYFNAETGQYDCKKCGERGNLITLKKHLGDVDIRPRKTNTFDVNLVEKCHENLPASIKDYLHQRGITDVVLEEYKIGYGKFYGKQWITIPIKDIYGNYSFFKLRQDPAFGNDKITYPKGVEAQLYGWETLINKKIIICEGEMDRLLLLSKGIPAITSTHGAMTFKEEWVKEIGKNKEIYVCFDNDETGKKGVKRVLEMVDNGVNLTHIISLPEDVGEKGDITDYFIKLGGSEGDLFNKYAKKYSEKIDITQFSPMSTEKLIDILGITIKYDEENKLATFLCELSAYTENSQFNISYNAPSSTGKSYIPTEIARLFPQDDVMEIAYSSPTAFFHENGQYDKDKNSTLIDLSRKILIFLDQPHNDLLARLRPLLSHDKKEIVVKITDKTQKGGTKTKTILLRGYPSVIFCTAGLNIDEQEATRFLLLSPEINQEKIKQGITATILKESDNKNFNNLLEENTDRALLKERIRAIKLEGIKEINIGSPEKIQEKFLSENKALKPRHQRDIKRLLSLVKAFALLNVWWRERSESTITANEDDINEAFKLWDKISVSQDLNLPPYVYNFYKEIVLSVWKSKNNDVIGIKLGVSRQELLEEHFRVYGRMMDSYQLRRQIIPMLETAGLIIQEQDPNDKRKMMIFPCSLYKPPKEKE